MPAMGLNSTTFRSTMTRMIVDKVMEKFGITKEEIEKVQRDL